MAKEIISRERFPKPGNMVNFIQVYSGPNMKTPRVFYDLPSVSPDLLISRSLEIVGLPIPKEYMGLPKLTDSKNYAVVGGAYAGITESNPNAGNLGKLVWETLDGKPYLRDFKLDTKHFGEFLKKIDFNLIIKHAGSAQGDRQNGR